MFAKPPRAWPRGLTSDRALTPEFVRAEGGNVGTIRGWFWGFVFVAMAVCFYWLDPSVYSIKYAVSADKIYVDPKPTDCDFWHAPVGKKGCHYQRVVIARDAKEVRAIPPARATPINDSILFLSHGSRSLIEYSGRVSLAERLSKKGTKTRAQRLLAARC